MGRDRGRYNSDDEEDEDEERPSRRTRSSRRDDEGDRPSRRRTSRSLRDDDSDYEDDREPRSRRSPTSRATYIVLGLFLGGLGIHNFIAGRTGVAVAQVVIFAASIPLMCVFIGFITIFIPSIWALVDIIAVTEDGEGRRMM
jgi:TM2 domain-containing membrane protein YozV